MNRKVPLAISILTFLLAGQSLRATTLVPMGLPEMANSAIAVVHGRVNSVKAAWTADHRSINSIVELHVITAIKGALHDDVNVVVPGGEMGRYQSIFVGAPAFREGDEVVLFLGARGPALPFILGWNQGVFRVARDPDTGVPLVRSIPLDEFARQVRAAIHEHVDVRRVR